MQAFVKLWAIGLLSLWFVLGCTADEEPKRGQLMVVLQTDMGIPKDVNAVTVQVFVRGQLQHDRKYTIAPDGEVKLPATIAVVAGEEPNPPVEVRVLGIRGQEVRVFSKSVTTIPRSRIATLHVPIQWLCDGQVLDLGEGTYDTSCEPDGEYETSCRAGSCERVDVNSEELPDYVPSQVFGGGAAPGDELGVCFSVENCLGNGFEVDPNLEDCTVELEIEEGQELNFGLTMTQASGDGICQDGGSCYIPLDQDDLFGWSETSSESSGDGERVVVAKLPTAVCEKLDAGEIESVVVSAACQTKTSQYPTCGPWSAVEEPSAFEPITSSPATAGAGGTGPESEGRGGAGGAPSGVSGSGGSADVVLEVEAQDGEDVLPVGGTIQLVVNGAGDAAGDVTWSSEDETIATVDQTGVVQGVTPGTTRIVATLADETAAFEVAVERGAPQSIELAADASSVAVGNLLELQATAVYADGEEVVSSGIVWQSSNPEVADVSSSGQVIGIEPGQVEIVAVFDGVESAPLVIEVLPPSLLRIQITEASGAGTADGTTQLVATGFYSNGTSRDVTSEVVWSSEDAAIVSVDETGLATSHAVGTVDVMAELGEVTGTVPFEVVQQGLAAAGGAGGTGGTDSMGIAGGGVSGSSDVPVSEAGGVGGAGGTSGGLGTGGSP